MQIGDWLKVKRVIFWDSADRPHSFPSPEQASELRRLYASSSCWLDLKMQVTLIITVRSDS